MLTLFPSFKRAGILGINARNLDYIFPNNPRRLYPLVDDKIETKRLANEAGIQTPELYGIIESLRDIRNLPDIVKGKETFVVKPSKGSGGGGITVFTGTTPNGYRKANGALMTHSDIRYYLSNIISGMYSMGGGSDRVIIEYTVKFDPMFDNIAFQGVPDIRILLFRGVPAMAMLRLPTRASDGKANLHMGGIGVGIDIATGKTLGGVQFGGEVSEHPETGHTVQGYQIPNWKSLLEMASRFYDITGLGYVGVDIVLDRDKGPMMLEVNARPGIAIQVANKTGLLDRLTVIENTDDLLTDPARRVAFAMKRFGD
jgi:alpha-L-glutamate ligase-like protein